MTPLFACFPVCHTFVALGIVVLLVSVPVRPPIHPRTQLQRPTRIPIRATLVVVLIFLAVALIFVLLNWVAADSEEPKTRARRRKTV